MVGSRRPGPLGAPGHPVDDINDGTTPRRKSRPSVAVGAGHLTHRPTHLLPIAHTTAGRAPRRAPTLRSGSTGDDVRKLQLLLNTRTTPSPALKLDGVFGPLT